MTANEEKWPEIPTSRRCYHLESTEGCKRFTNLMIKNKVLAKGITFEISQNKEDGSIWIEILAITEL